MFEVYGFDAVYVFRILVFLNFGREILWLRVYFEGPGLLKT